MVRPRTNRWFSFFPETVSSSGLDLGRRLPGVTLLSLFSNRRVGVEIKLVLLHGKTVTFN